MWQARSGKEVFGEGTIWFRQATMESLIEHLTWREIEMKRFSALLLTLSMIVLFAYGCDDDAVCGIAIPVGFDLDGLTVR